MNNQLVSELLTAVKDESGIYWDEIDDRLTTYIYQGYEWLKVFNNYEDITFEKYSLEFQLITQYARYSYNNYLDMFEDNYQMLINKLAVKYALDKEV